MEACPFSFTRAPSCCEFVGGGTAAYEAESLLWKGSSYRPYSPEEKAVVMGLPPSFTDPVKAIVSRPAMQLAARNSLVASGLHLPSFLLAMLVMFQVVHAKPFSLLWAAPLSYTPDEQCLGRSLP